jgi:Ser/Thr protein kinase RdoA (MazF antagonist)
VNQAARPAGPAPPETARAAIALYPLSASCRAELVRYGENTTYRLTDGRRSLALRLGRPGYQCKASMESEIAWMSALRERGIETPAALAGINGAFVQEVRLPHGDVQLAAAFEWVQGIPLPEVDGLDAWARLGEIMAEVHQHTRAWQPPPGFTRPAWDQDAVVGDSPRWGTPVPAGVWSERDAGAILAARDAVRERLARFGTGSERFGLIHADLGFENVLVQPDGRTILIDFDDCGPSWYLYELASVLYPMEASADFHARVEMLIAGYRRVRALSDADLAELPTFLMCRRLTTLGWTFSRPDTPHAQRQRSRRLAASPAAARRFLQWHAASPD